MRYEKRVKRLVAPALAAAFVFLGAAPAHVQTCDYFGGYAGTHLVAPEAGARWLTWAETNIPDSVKMRALGVKTLLYTDPNRQIAGEPLYTSDESTFAHDCGGNRITTNRSGQYLMDPHAPAMQRIWRGHVQSYAGEGHFDAVFNDDADNVEYIHGVPCNYNATDWLSATNALQRSLNYPIIYNGLSSFNDTQISQAIGLNPTSIGGAMEECYASSPSQPKQTGSKWIVAENTELRMQQERKFFFCYNNDTSPAAGSIGSRLYVYASFLLTYDPATSVLWEYYEGPTHFHVMPEVQLVPLDPVAGARTVADLNAGGVYVRAFRSCYLAGRPAGPCAVAVNPDGDAHALSLQGYRRMLQIDGGGVLDGGSVRIVAFRPPAQLGPATAIVAFK